MNPGGEQQTCLYGETWPESEKEDPNPQVPKGEGIKKAGGEGEGNWEC